MHFVYYNKDIIYQFPSFLLLCINRINYKKHNHIAIFRHKKLINQLIYLVYNYQNIKYIKEIYVNYILILF
jgi:hypothetical protein